MGGAFGGFLMKIRKVKTEDKDEWARMRNELWPGTLQEHRDEIDSILNTKPILERIHQLCKNTKR